MRGCTLLFGRGEQTTSGRWQKHTLENHVFRSPLWMLLALPGGALLSLMHVLCGRERYTTICSDVVVTTQRDDGDCADGGSGGMAGDIADDIILRIKFFRSHVGSRKFPNVVDLSDSSQGERTLGSWQHRKLLWRSALAGERRSANVILPWLARCLQKSWLLQSAD